MALHRFNTLGACAYTGTGRLVWQEELYRGEQEIEPVCVNRYAYTNPDRAGDVFYEPIGGSGYQVLENGAYWHDDLCSHPGYGRKREIEKGQ